MPTIIDALITTITLDPKGYKQGQQEVEKSNKKIKDDIRGLEDQIASIRQKSTKDTKAQDTAQINSYREVIRQKRRSLEDNRSREIEQLKRTKEQTAAIDTMRGAALELFSAFGIAGGVGAFAKFAINMGIADAQTGRFADNLGEDAQTINAFGAVLEGVGGKADDARAAFAALAAIRFGIQTGDASAFGKLTILSRLGVSAQDLKDLDATMRKIAATAKTMPKALFYQYAHAAGFSDSVINALELGDVELAKRIEAAKKREGMTADDIARAQAAQHGVGVAKGMARGYTRGMEGAVADDVDAISRLLHGDVGGAWQAYKKAQGENFHSLADPASEMFNHFFGPKAKAATGSGASLATSPRGRPSAALTSARAKFAIDWLKSQGVSDAAARGAVAGAIAESNGLDPNAQGPMTKYGRAFGIGQWLDTPGSPRKSRLFQMFGPNPGFDKQLQYLLWELRGGDRGGASVLNSTSSGAALDAYVRNFMRPHAGAETLGDLVRGARALSTLGLDGPSVAGKVATSGITSDVHIGRIEVTVPPGSDGKKIAQETAAAVRHQPFVAMANTGLA